MSDFIQQNWPVIAVVAAWLARERLNLLALGAWVVAGGGLAGLARKLFTGAPKPRAGAQPPSTDQKL